MDAPTFNSPCKVAVLSNSVPGEAPPQLSLTQQLRSEIPEEREHAFDTIFRFFFMGIQKSGTSDMGNEMISFSFDDSHDLELSSFFSSEEDLKIIKRITHFLRNEEGEIHSLENLDDKVVEVTDEEGNPTGFSFISQPINVIDFFDNNDTLSRALFLNYQNPHSPDSSFFEQKLTEFSSYKVKLKCMNGEMHIVNTSLKYAQLDDMMLEGLVLENIIAPGISLQRTVLNQARWGGLTLNHVNLSYAQLCNAVVKITNMDDGDLSNANLDGINIEQSSMVDVDLRGTNLSNARLFEVVITGAKINAKTQCHNTTIILDFAFCSALKTILQCDANSNRSRLLMTIDCINDKDLKINLIHQIIDALQNIDVSSTLGVFMEIFKEDSVYMQDKKIVNFLMNRLCSPSMIAAVELRSKLLQGYN